MDFALYYALINQLCYQDAHLDLSHLSRYQMCSSDWISSNYLWHFASLELSQYANACLWQRVWSLSLKGDRIYTVRRSSIVALHNTSPTRLENGVGLLPWDGISLVWLGRKLIYSPPPPPTTGLDLFMRASKAETHMCSRVWGGATEDKQQQEKTQRGKHSWLPLPLLTPAVGCNLHSNRTWKHCAELIFEVVIFNNPPLHFFLTAAFYGN